MNLHGLSIDWGDKLYMKQEFEIFSDIQSYEIGEKSVYGELWIKCGNIAFPFEKWGDLIVSCFSMWLENLNRLTQNPTCNKVEFYFMDGPHFFTAEKFLDSTFRLEFYSYEKLVFTTFADRTAFSLEIKRVANQILSKLTEYHSQKYNIKELKKYLI